MRREELGPLKNQRRQSSLEFLDTVGQVVNYSTLWGILDIVDLNIYVFYPCSKCCTYVTWARGGLRVGG